MASSVGASPAVLRAPTVRSSLLFSVSTPAPSSARAPAAEGFRHQAMLIGFCVWAYLFNLGATHLWDEDEAYFGATAVSMMASGDYIVPHFNEAISLHKPAFLYWMMIAGARLFGTNEFAFRLGSVVFSIANVLLTYRIGRRLFTPRAAFWSAASLATCLQFFVIARSAVVDSTLTFFCMLPLAILLEPLVATGKEVTRTSWRRWAGAYAAMAVATLVKGPVGFVLPMGVIGLTLLIGRAETSAANPSRTRWAWVGHANRWLAGVFRPAAIWQVFLNMRPLTAIVVIAAIAGPWYTAVGLQSHGEWLRGFLLIHNVERFTTTFEQHDGGPIYYPVAILLGFFPWTILVVSSLRLMAKRLRQGQADGRAYRLLIAWVLVWVTAFTFSGTKLPHYVLPAYPAVALMIGAFVDHWLGQPNEKSSNLSLAWISLILLGGAASVALIVVSNMLKPHEPALPLFGLIPMIGGAVALWAASRRRPLWAVSGVLATAMAFGVFLLGVGGPLVDRHQTSPQVARWLRELSPRTQPVLRTYAFFQESLVYYCAQPIVQLDDGSQVAAFFAEHADGLVLTTRSHVAEIKSSLPSDIRELRTTPRFLKTGDLLLLGSERVYVRPPEPTVATNVEATQPTLARLGKRSPTLPEPTSAEASEPAVWTVGGPSQVTDTFEG